MPETVNTGCRSIYDMVPAQCNVENVPEYFAVHLKSLRSQSPFNLCMTDGLAGWLNAFNQMLSVQIVTTRNASACSEQQIHQYLGKHEIPKDFDAHTHTHTYVLIGCITLARLLTSTLTQLLPTDCTLFCVCGSFVGALCVCWCVRNIDWGVERTYMFSKMVSKLMCVYVGEEQQDHRVRANGGGTRH